LKNNPNLSAPLHSLPKSAEELPKTDALFIDMSFGVRITKELLWTQHPKADVPLLHDAACNESASWYYVVG